MSGCIWCGRSPTTNTHALRKSWLQQLLPGTKLLYHRHVRERPEGVELDREWEQPQFGIDPHCACATCNSGWMNEWDERGERLAEPMTFGRAQTLTDDDRRVLAAWLTLVAIILDQIQRPPVVRPETRKMFYAAPAPLPNSAIWLARTETSRAMANMWPVSWEVVAPTSGEVSHPYFCTIRVNDFVAQVFIPDESWRGGNFKLDGRISQPLWPWSGAIGWPPIGVVREDDLSSYVMRFATR